MMQRIVILSRAERPIQMVACFIEEKNTLHISDLVAAIKKSERSKRITWKEAKKQIAKWK